MSERNIRAGFTGIEYAIDKRNSENRITFRIHIQLQHLYSDEFIEWMQSFFDGILKYLHRKYASTDDDWINIEVHHARGMRLWVRKYKDLDIKQIIGEFCETQVGDISIRCG